MEQHILELAAKLAREAVEKGEGGPFGAVVVQDGAVVAAAHNRVLATNDPTAHAEIVAIREACEKLGTFHLVGCEIYTTCEPCPMCLAAIHWAHLDRVVYTLTRDDAAAIGFDDAHIYRAMTNPAVEVEQIPNPDAEEAFRLWEQKEDRVDY